MLKAMIITPIIGEQAGYGNCPIRYQVNNYLWMRLIGKMITSNALSEPSLWRNIGDQLKKIHSADLKYPIILSAEGNVMDGMHRILMCYAFEMDAVKAVRGSKTPEPDMVRSNKAETYESPNI
jgi:hypothetical protein